MKITSVSTGRALVQYFTTPGAKKLGIRLKIKGSIGITHTHMLAYKGRQRAQTFDGLFKTAELIRYGKNPFTETSLSYQNIRPRS